MPELGERELNSLDIQPFKHIKAEDLKNTSNIVRKCPLENLGIMAQFTLRSVPFEEIPFIERGKMHDKSWQLSGELLRSPPLSKDALNKIAIVVRFFPENKLFASKVEEIEGKRVFRTWREVNEKGELIPDAKEQPLLLGNNLIKIQKLKLGGIPING